MNFEKYNVKNYKGIWMSPSIAIKRLDILLERCGNDLKRILANGTKHEREAWVAGVFLLGLNEIQPSQYWLEIVVEEATPDIYGYKIDIINGNYHRGVYNIEITDFEEHSKTIEDIIKQKSFKSYPDYFQLLIYARKGGYLLDYDAIFDSINKISIPFANIFILSASSYEDDYELVQIYPLKWRLSFNLHSVIQKNINQKELATFLKRGSGTDLTNLGVLSLPLPEII